MLAGHSGAQRGLPGSEWAAQEAPKPGAEQGSPQAPLRPSPMPTTLKQSRTDGRGRPEQDNLPNPHPHAPPRCSPRREHTGLWAGPRGFRKVGQSPQCWGAGPGPLSCCSWVSSAPGHSSLLRVTPGPACRAFVSDEGSRRDRGAGRGEAGSTPSRAQSCVWETLRERRRLTDPSPPEARWIRTDPGDTRWVVSRGPSPGGLTCLFLWRRHLQELSVL